MRFDLFPKVGAIEHLDAKDSSRSSPRGPDTAGLRYVNEYKPVELLELQAEVVVARPTPRNVERRAAWIG
ncbi:MAG: hypothetical protein ACRDLA_18860, partial [Thermoleophilaceae bacterium]